MMPRLGPESFALRRRGLHDQQTLGERAAARVAGWLGSWRYLGLQTAFMLFWISLNVGALVRHWDPYPFLLLNIFLSTQASYAAPLLQLSTNRLARADRARDNLEADEVSALVRMHQQMLDEMALLRSALDNQNKQVEGEP